MIELGFKTATSLFKAMHAIERAHRLGSYFAITTHITG